MQSKYASLWAIFQRMSLTLSTYFTQLNCFETGRRMQSRRCRSRFVEPKLQVQRIPRADFIKMIKKTEAKMPPSQLTDC